jgi:hypothetical protein
MSLPRCAPFRMSLRHVKSGSALPMLKPIAFQDQLRD